MSLSQQEKKAWDDWESFKKQHGNYKFSANKGDAQKAAKMNLSRAVRSITPVEFEQMMNEKAKKKYQNQNILR